MDDKDRNSQGERGEQSREDRNPNRNAQPGAHPGGYGPAQGELGEGGRSSDDAGEITQRLPRRE